MNSEGALWLLGLAVTVSSISLLMNAIASFGAFRAVKRLERKVEPLIPEAMSAINSAQAMLKETLVEIHDLSDRAKSVLDATQAQVDALDTARTDITERLRIQSERAELIVEDTLSRVQEVVHVFHNGVMRPVREVNGVMAGIKTAVQTLVAGRRPSVARATQDDEMFI